MPDVSPSVDRTLATLAQGGGWPDAAWEILLRCAVVLAVGFILGSLGVADYRRYTRTESGGSPGFTLSEIRRLHREGQLSDEEFARARSAILASMGVAASEGAAGEEGDNDPDATGSDKSERENPPSATS